MFSVRNATSCMTTSSYPLSLRIGRQVFLLHFHYLNPINPDLSLLVRFVVWFGHTAFFFGRQRRVRFGVRLDLRFALFSLEAIVFIAQALNLFGLLGHFDRELFHQIHQRDEHLAQTFIFNRCRIEIFYHIPTVPVPLGVRLGSCLSLGSLGTRSSSSLRLSADHVRGPTCFFHQLIASLGRCFPGLLR